MIARHLIIHGKVQGVWYRDWTVQNARELGLTGWVRNRAEGTVEAHVEGEESLVWQMIARMHEGPPDARVERVDEQADEMEELDRFDRR